jgi:hypothetical protein
VLAEEYGSLRNLHGGNKSKKFKHHTCYERPKVYGMLACVSYDCCDPFLWVSISFQIFKVVDDEM